jgi:uncharacterized protein
MSKQKRTEVPAIISATLRRDREALMALAKGEATNERDRDGRAALHHAVINGDDEITAALLGAGADANARDAAGWTALHFAAAEYHISLAKMLLHAGASVDSEDSDGNTPLFRAVFESRGRGEMIRLLIAHGADASHANRYGVTPASLAATIANYDVAQWLQ